MSADEIKALAQQSFVDGMASHRAGLLDMEVRCKQYAAALLSFAVMVERANERRGEFAVNYGRVDYEFDTAMVDEIDYILTGKEAE